MTFTAFDIILPIALGIAYGAYRYFTLREADPANAMRQSVRDAAVGIIGMAIMTVLIKLT